MVRVEPGVEQSGTKSLPRATYSASSRPRIAFMPGLCSTFTDFVPPFVPPPRMKKAPQRLILLDKFHAYNLLVLYVHAG